jgi:putative peptidoglycan lipid II flippase
MAPALLGVGVAQLSLLINTQIASHLGAGSVSWLSYADRLMEFPTALLGVALGVVLMPQLAAAKAANDTHKFSSMLDWGLRLVVMSSAPCAVVLLLFSHPLVAVLYHYGAFTANDVEQTSRALMGYGIGLLGLIAIKVLAPGFYASQDIRTPVKIAVLVLICTQLLNTLFVPYFAHAGLALAIGVGALINAGLLWLGLIRSGRYTPLPGWTKFFVQILLACLIMGGFLYWANTHWDWTALRANVWIRIGLVTSVLSLAGAFYLGALVLLGMNLRTLVKT